MGYEYLNPDQALCVNTLLIRISLNQFAVCKWGYCHLIWCSSANGGVQTLTMEIT